MLFVAYEARNGRGAIGFIYYLSLIVRLVLIDEPICRLWLIMIGGASNFLF